VLIDFRRRLERGRVFGRDTVTSPHFSRKVRLIELSDLLPHRWQQRRDAVAAFCAALARFGRGD
jgi:hypothetical protein